MKSLKIACILGAVAAFVAGPVLAADSTATPATQEMSAPTAAPSKAAPANHKNMHGKKHTHKKGHKHHKKMMKKTG